VLWTQLVGRGGGEGRGEEGGSPDVVCGWLALCARAGVRVFCCPFLFAPLRTPSVLTLSVWLVACAPSSSSPSSVAFAGRRSPVFQWHTDLTGKLRECDPNYRASLLRRDRKLLRSGTLSIASEPSQVYLFNDLLLVAEAEEPKSSKSKLAKTLLRGKRRAPASSGGGGASASPLYSYRYSLSLLHCEVEEKDAKSLMLKTPERNLLAVFKSVNACEVWLRDLREAERRCRTRLLGVSVQQMQRVQRQALGEVPLVFEHLLARLADLTPVNATHLFAAADPLSQESAQCVHQLEQASAQGPAALLDVVTALSASLAAALLLRLLLELDHSLVASCVLSGESGEHAPPSSAEHQRREHVDEEAECARGALATWLRHTASVSTTSLLQALQHRVREISSLSALIRGVSLAEVVVDLGPLLVDVTDMRSALAFDGCVAVARTLFARELAVLLRSPRSAASSSGSSSDTSPGGRSTTTATSAIRTNASPQRRRGGGGGSGIRHRTGSRTQIRKPLPPPPPSAPKLAKPLPAAPPPSDSSNAN
jgi:hypothetical protein